MRYGLKVDKRQKKGPLDSTPSVKNVLDLNRFSLCFLNVHSVMFINILTALTRLPFFQEVVI